ncbi:MAG: hypothetical protein JSR99_17290 [Proteobacteria bacterium]|nr:hypothetical protein [Pseudomonadota bacterium]
MRFSVNFGAALALAATFAVATTVSANAECKRYGFSVNDYGKDGPTKDAKDLLDKLITTKMSERGVKDYKTGKKSVSCELFLNFIVFDEHTCTAEATVCWGGSKLPGSEQASTDAAEPAKKPETAAAEKPAKKKVTKEAAVHTEAAPVPVTHKTAAQAIPDPKSLIYRKAKSPAGSQETAAAAPVETGSLSESATKHKAHKPAGDSAEVAPIKQTSGGAGYPTPQPPSDGDGAQ